jgi:hypothetical protein
MGIERFFNSLTQVEKIKTNGIIVGLKDKILSNFVYIDFNSVIHNISSEIEHDLNYLLYSIILHTRNPTKYPLDEFTLIVIEKYTYMATDVVKKFDPLKGITVENFLSTFPKEYIDEIVLTKIREHIIYITTKLIDPNEVKQIFIAFDGVPQMSKVIEQKTRRYNGYVIGELKAKIFADAFVQIGDTMIHCFDIDDTDEILNNLTPRREFELNKIGIDRGRITTRATLMDRVNAMLENEDFKNEMHSFHPLLEKIVISNTGVYGEGEKKIMENIIELGTNRSGTYTIYSPDADVVILGLICLNRLDETSNVSILRFNQQSEEYDYVDIKGLRNNIYNMVLPRITTSNVRLLNEITITNDLAFIFTLFGNDFVPRIEAIDARNDIETLIFAYCKYLNIFRGQPLIFYENGYRIKYKDKDISNGLVGYLSILAEEEEALLKETYMSVTYKNYKRLKTMIGVTKLLPILKSYVYTSNNVFKQLKKIADASKELDDNGIKQQIIEFAQTITNKQYMRHFMIFEKKKDNVLESDPELFNMFVDLMFKKVKDCIQFEKEHKKYFFGKLRLEPYDTDKIDTTFHENNIKDTLPHPKCKITKYDEECYKLDRKLGDYESKLNSINFELGNIGLRSIPSRTAEQLHYKLFSGTERANHTNDVESYYQTFFGVTHENADEMLQNIVYEYTLGLIWIFDFYFNRNSSTLNIEKVSTWTYSYHRAPLLSQIAYYIDGVNLKKLLYDINKSYVNRSEYLNILEHYMYITPKNRMVSIPHEYEEFILQNPQMYPDLNDTVNRIWNGDNVNEIIDCKRVNFLSKCNLLSVNYVSYDEYFQKIKHLRRIEDVPSKDVHNTIHVYNTERQSGGRSNLDKLKYYKNYFKLLYMKTGIIKYKKYYKSIKNQLEKNYAK